MRKRRYRLGAILAALLMLLSINGVAEATLQAVQQVKLHYVIDYMQNILEYTGVGVTDEDGCYQFTFDTKGLPEDINGLFVQFGESGLVFGKQAEGLTEIRLEELIKLVVMSRVPLGPNAKQASAAYDYLFSSEFREDAQAVGLLLQNEVNRAASCLAKHIIVQGDGDVSFRVTLNELVDAAATYLELLSEDAEALNALFSLNIWSALEMDAAVIRAHFEEKLQDARLSCAERESLTGVVYMHVSPDGDVNASVEYDAEGVSLRANLQARAGGERVADVKYINDDTQLEMSLVSNGTGNMTISQYAIIDNNTMCLFMDAAQGVMTCELSYASAYGARMNAHMRFAPEANAHKLYLFADDGDESRELNAVYDEGELRLNYTGMDDNEVITYHKLLASDGLMLYNGKWDHSGENCAANIACARVSDKLHFEGDVSVADGYGAYPFIADVSAVYDNAAKALEFKGFASANDETVTFDGGMECADELKFSLNAQNGRDIRLRGKHIDADNVKGFELEGVIGDMPISARCGIEKLESSDVHKVSFALFLEVNAGDQAQEIRVPIDVEKTGESGVRITASVNFIKQGESQRLGGIMLELENTYVTPPAHVRGAVFTVDDIIEGIPSIGG